MAQQKQQSRTEADPVAAGDLSRRHASTPEDPDSDSEVERVEVLAAGAEDLHDIEDGDLGEKLNELAATTDEEVDALRVNLLQNDEPSSRRDSSGRIVDEIADGRRHIPLKEA